jgi:hypothetical protein
VKLTHYCNLHVQTPQGFNSMLGGSLSTQHGESSGCGRRNGLQLLKVAANILNKQPRENDKEWSSSLGIGRGANNISL